MIGSLIVHESTILLPNSYVFATKTCLPSPIIPFEKWAFLSCPSVRLKFLSGINLSACYFQGIDPEILIDKRLGSVYF